MTILELRDLASPDADVDVWQPQSNSVWILVELDIGPKGKEGADIFQVMIATPEGLREQATADANGILSDRATIVLRQFSWAAARAAIATIIRECDSNDWIASVLRLQRYFQWEYEDYVEDSESS